MTSIVSITQFFVLVAAFLLTAAAAAKAFRAKPDAKFLLVSMDLEFILGRIVGANGVLYPSFPILIRKRDIYKPVCLTIVLGFMVTSMSLSKLLLTEQIIRFIQALVNAAACVYLAYAWGDSEDKKAKAQGDNETIPGEYISGPPPRGYAKPKSLRQRELASRVNQ